MKKSGKHLKKLPSGKSFSKPLPPKNLNTGVASVRRKKTSEDLTEKRCVVCSRTFYWRRLPGTFPTPPATCGRGRCLDTLARANASHLVRRTALGQLGPTPRERMIAHYAEGKPFVFQPARTSIQQQRRYRRNSRNRKRQAFYDRLADKIAAGTIDYEDFPRLTLRTAILAHKALMSKTDLFTPRESARLRTRIGDILADNLDEAAEAMRGQRHWTNAQVKLFSVFLNKVVPDLSASYSVVERRTVNASDLTREELERIAAGLDDTIEIKAEELPNDPQHRALPHPDEPPAGDAGEGHLEPRPGLDPAGEPSGGDPLPVHADDGVQRD